MIIIAMLVSAILMSSCGPSEETEKIDYTWESIAKVSVLKWFEDVKSGIFIHWGAYSVPGIALEGYT